MTVGMTYIETRLAVRRNLMLYMPLDQEMCRERAIRYRNSKETDALEWANYWSELEHQFACGRYAVSGDFQSLYPLRYQS